jgi:hypothetical protein
MEPVEPIKPFGKLDLKFKKNQDKLDKYCMYKIDRSGKYQYDIRKACPPLSKRYKAKYKFLQPPRDPEKAVVSTKYLGGVVKYHWDRYYTLSHDIGRVNFFKCDYYQDPRARKKIQGDSLGCRIDYYYKPIREFPYIPAPVPLIEPSDIAAFQKFNRAEEKREQLSRVYQYLRTHDKWSATEIFRLATEPIPTDTTGYAIVATTSTVYPPGFKPSINELAKRDWFHWSTDGFLLSMVE